MNSFSTIKNSYLSLIALVLAFLGLALSMAPKVYYAATPQPQYTQDQKITNIILIAKKVRENLSDQSRKQGTPTREIKKAYNLDSMCMYASLCIALFGVVFSVLAYIKKENKRIYIGAIALSLMTFLMNFIWIALGVIVIMLVIKTLDGFAF